MADPNVRLAIREARTYIAIVHCGNPGCTAIRGLSAYRNGNMSLNRHNPFVASLSTLVEPASGAPASTVPATAFREAEHPTFLERFESLAAFGQTLGSEPDAPAAELPDQATIEARMRKLYPYYY